MPPKPLIVMALEAEGQGRLEALGYEVLYCGVGKVNAAYCLTRRLSQGAASGKSIPFVLNMGSAGSNRFKSGQLVAAERFVQRDMDATGLGFAHGQTPYEEEPFILAFPKRFPNLSHGICGSGDSFLQGAPPVECDIIDMEAYALAKICKRENLSFACVKYITDGADHAASTDWQENLRHAAQAFADFLSPPVG